jgi:non-specific serine/threonine protein kinase
MGRRAFAEAVLFARRAEAMDPMRDSIARRLMTALELAGDAAAAIEVYRGLRERLYEDLSTSPDPETTHLFHEIRERSRRKKAASPPGRSPVAENKAQVVQVPASAAARPPMPITHIIGREQEVRELRERVSGARLVTIVGAGGVGKTRLAVEIANQIEAELPGCVVWVELAHLVEGKLILPALAGALEIRQEGAADADNLLSAVAQRLSIGKILVVLDNCEHLIDAAATLVQQLLSRSQDLRILVTSRQRLGLAGEATWRAPSLAIAEPDELPADAAKSVEAAREAPAVQLFIERAREARPDFVMATREDAEAVCRICKRLDGIPLAIELAAARTRSMTVVEIQSKLDSRFSLLTGGSRAALPRQKTLRSLIDWSYDLLSSPEQRLLARLSIFVGGWTLEAAEKVCSGGGIAQDEMLDHLSSLADQSLVVAETTGNSTRYHLLETVRQYARDTLVQSGDESFWRDRHFSYFSALAEEAEPKLWTGSSQEEWLGRLETENDNLRAGMEWTSHSADRGLDNLRLSGALWRFWIARPRPFEGLAHLTRALSVGPTDDSKERARALTGAGNLAFTQGDFASARLFQEECLEMRRRMGDDRKQLAGTINNLGVALFGAEDFDAAKMLFEDCLSVYRETGDRWLEACSLGNLATIASIRGDNVYAREAYEECLSIQREFGDRYAVGTSLYNLGITALGLGDTGSARDFYLESLALRSELGDTAGIASCLEAIAAVGVMSGEHVRAAQLWGAADRLRYEIGVHLTALERRDYDRHVADCRHAIGDESFDNGWEEGSAAALDELMRQCIESSV